VTTTPGALGADSNVLETKTSYLLTGSEVVKQWAITGTTLQCVNTFQIGAYRKDLHLRDGCYREVISLDQVNEDVFVGQCFQKEWRRECVQFWNIKKPSAPFLLLEDVELLCVLKSVRNTVAVNVEMRYTGSGISLLLYSLDDRSTKKLINGTGSVIVDLKELSNGVLVGVNSYCCLAWWDVETGVCLMKCFSEKQYTQAQPVGLVVIENDRLLQWWRDFRDHVIIDWRPDEISETVWSTATTSILSVARRKSGGLFVSTNDRMLRIYDSDMNEVVLCGSVKTSKAISVCEMSDGSIACLTENGTIAVWKITPPK